MRYMLLLYIEDRPQGDAPEAAAYYSAIGDFHRECQRRGVLIASSPLQAPAGAKTIRVRDGKVLRTDGPFAETTEWLGGYFVLDCRDRDQAIELARLCPTSREGTVEVRPILELPTG